MHAGVGLIHTHFISSVGIEVASSVQTEQASLGWEQALASLCPICRVGGAAGEVFLFPLCPADFLSTLRLTSP